MNFYWKLYEAGDAVWEAMQALWAGDYALAWWWFSQATIDLIQADAWFDTAKQKLEGPSITFANVPGNHGGLHEPLVWNAIMAIAPSCAYLRKDDSPKDREMRVFQRLRSLSSQTELKVSTSIRIVVIGALILAVPSGARAADATVLFGLMAVNGPRPAFGVAIGHAPSVAGFEIEFLGTWGGESADHSVAGGTFGNLIVQPVLIRNLQFYAIIGFGIWAETFADRTGTGLFGAKDIGGGMKARITERLRLRLDYRLFLLSDPDDASRLPTSKRPQRISAGLHVAF